MADLCILQKTPNREVRKELWKVCGTPVAPAQENGAVYLLVQFSYDRQLVKTHPKMSRISCTSTVFKLPDLE